MEHLLAQPEYMQCLVHFNPYSYNCDLCEGGIKVDASLKLETWDKDMQFIRDVLQMLVRRYKYGTTVGTIVAIVLTVFIEFGENRYSSHQQIYKRILI